MKLETSKNPKNKKIKIALTGGGTGGHITPLIAVARELKKIDSTLQFIYIGPTRNIKELFKKDDIKVWPLITGRFRRYITPTSILLNFMDGFLILFGFLQAFIYLILYRPTIIFSKGGYGSFPTIILAWLLRIPIIAHESDSIGGSTNKLLARFATKIIISFEGEYKGFAKNKTVLLGTPLRAFGGITSKTAKKQFSIVSNKPVIFITGASQGAKQINELVLEILEELTQKYEIIHQTGDKNYKIVALKANQLPKKNKESYRIFSFLQEEQMEAAYVAADIVVSRASSTNLFEIAMLAKPSILIPLPTAAKGHQEKNAEIYARAGATIILNPHTVTSDELLKTITNLINNEQKLTEMSASALAFAKPNAAQDIAELILKYATKNN